MIWRIKLLYYWSCFSLFGMVVILAFNVIRGDMAHPEDGLSYDDWPNGRSSDADHWHSGIFLNRKADRIRWIGKDEGDHVSSVRFFARIPMQEEHFQQFLAEIKNYRMCEADSMYSSFSKEVVFVPEWFPKDCLIKFTGQAEGLQWFRAEEPYLYVYMD
jgi:hypothetical protein